MAFESFSGSTADHSSSTPTPLWVRNPTCTVHGLECGKPHLCQTAHPFLPTLIETLERHGHLHLTEACRNQLLFMSAATADRLLRSQRKPSQRGISTTRAGTLLKQQIPIRTFQEWNETQPGFLEVDLMAHCGTDIEGGYVYTAFAHRCGDRMDGMSSPPLP